MWRFRSLSVALVLVAACSGGADPGPDSVPRLGASSPVEAVNALVAAFDGPDFEAAAALAMPDQAALAALSEGATFGDVASAIREETTTVSSNFWAGFAQGVGGALSGSVSAVEDGTTTQDGVLFRQVEVKTTDGESRMIYTRESDGHRIDLFASFGAGLAGRMAQPVERLLGSDTEDSKLILESLQEIVPSLMVAASQEGLPTGSVQEILTLIELITRVS